MAPRGAMEEEEEEDEELEEEEEEGDEYDYDQGNDSGAGEEEEPHVSRGFAPQRRNGPYPSKRIPTDSPIPPDPVAPRLGSPPGLPGAIPEKQDDDYEEEDGDDDPLKAEKRPTASTQ